MQERLPAHVEAAAIIRRVAAAGGFAAVLRKGDPDRGALTLLIHERGALRGLLERQLGPDFSYRWCFKDAADVLGSGSLEDWITRNARFDADLWLIELDVADPERFIAETTSAG